MAEQRYEAVRAVIADGETVTDVAARFGVARKTVHAWLARYEAGGLEGLADRSHRPRSCPHQMAAAVEVRLAELQLAQPSWGPRRLAFELARRDAGAVSESAAYRALVRLNLIEAAARRPRDRKWRRWERGAPMELWQMDVVGGFVLADGTRARCLVTRTLRQSAMHARRRADQAMRRGRRQAGKSPLSTTPRHGRRLCLLARLAGCSLGA